MERKQKEKEKPVPVIHCGVDPVWSNAKGLGYCFFCRDCLMRGEWKKTMEAATESWNVAVQQAKDNRR